MSQTIHVLMITHKSGHNLSAHSTKDKAVAALDKHVRKNWQSRGNRFRDEGIPDSAEDAADLYFTDNEEEFYDFIQLTIDKEE